MSDKNSVSKGQRTFEGLRGHRVEDHIEDVLDMVEIGAGAMRLEVLEEKRAGYLKELGHE